ncbi:putative fungal specific transcription [Rosellinia necatrix]|uniref:Putative fungal specific transcription n=1 Tax=Rosellinia necatrix TaxID=77044 RepID=A0A1W2TN47_ROSNE|nr:putative fungal specific transcription [Rosellinia necatrix]
MNMSNISRHIACKLCRDRKVRCDGGQPSCEKCRRSGETCIYVPTHKPTKADLAQTIESLQERLDKAEAYILRHGNPNKPALANDQPPPPIATPGSAIGVEYGDCSPFNLQMATTATTVQPGDPFMTAAAGGLHGIPPTPFSRHSLPMSPETMDSEFMNYIPSSHMGMTGDPLSSSSSSHYQMEDPRRMVDDLSGASTASSSFRRESIYSQQQQQQQQQQHHHHHRQMPSLREVRVMMNGSSAAASPPPSPSSRGHRADDANHILAELTAFGMAVFSAQAEIAGISSVVAEYLEWMRKATPSSSSAAVAVPMTTTTTTTTTMAGGGMGVGMGVPKTSPAVLETLEMRVRELNLLAATRHVEAWRQSVHRLERIPGVGAMLNLFDNEMQRRSNDTAEFFQTGYNACLPLGEQMGRKE